MWRNFNSMLVSGCLVFLVFSGMMKWIPFPLDPTLISGALCSLVLVVSVLRGVQPLGRGVFIPVLVVFGFFAWYLSTISYTSSSSHWETKALGVVLGFLAFIYPLFCFRTREDFKYYENTIVVLALITSSFIWYYYLSGELSFFLQGGFDRKESKIPNYLSMGVLIGSGALILLSRRGVLNISLFILCFASIAMVGARGPFLFLLFISAIAIMFLDNRIRSRGKRLGLAVFGLGLLVAVVVGVMQWQGAQRIRDRLPVLFQTDNVLWASGRDQVVSASLDVISSNFVWGSGLGGFGVSGYNLDINIYPHNLFLEAWTEAGLPGFILFVVSIGLMVSRVRTVFALHSRQSVLYYMLFWFVFLNYMKSGGFIGARDFYMHMAVFLTFIYSRVDCKSQPSRSSGRRRVHVKQRHRYQQRYVAPPKSIRKERHSSNDRVGHS